MKQLRRERQNVSFLELSEMVQRDSCKVGEQGVLHRAPEEEKTSRGPKPDDSYYQCGIYVTWLVPARIETRPQRAYKGILWNCSWKPPTSSQKLESLPSKGRNLFEWVPRDFPPMIFDLSWYIVLSKDSQTSKVSPFSLSFS